MRNTKSLRRLCSIVMVLSLLIGMVSVMGGLPVAAAETTEPLNASLSVDIDLTGQTALPTVGTDEFGVYYFNNTTFAATSATPATVATAMKYRTTGGGAGLLDFNSVSTSQWAALTCTEKRVTDFSATYTFYPLGNEGTAFMGIMVGEKGEFGVSLDNDNSNDTGLLITTAANQGLNVVGAINESGYANSPAVGLRSKLTYFGDKVANRRGQVHTDTTETKIGWTTAPSTAEALSEDLYTITVQVKGKYLTVWNHAAPDLKTVVELSDNYAGGYVSFVELGYNSHGSFKSISISEDFYDVEYDVPIDGTNTAPADINNDFGVFHFDKTGTEAINRIPYEPNAELALSTDSIGKYAMHAGWHGVYGNNLLDFGVFPNAVNDSGAKTGLAAMTYLKQRYTDFTVEYTYYPVGNLGSGYHMGIMVGEMGNMGLSFDGNSANDTGLLITISADGSGAVHIAGAVSADSNAASAANGFSTKVTWFDDVACLRSSISLASGASSWADGSVTADSVLTTVVIQVQGRQVHVWNKLYPEKKVTATLSENYAGGYVSWVKTMYNAGALKSLSIRDDAPDKNVVDKAAYPMIKSDATYAEKLDNDFETYRFNTSVYSFLPANVTEAQATASGLPSDNLMLSTSTYSKGWLTFNNRTALNALTYKQKVTNFRAEFTAYPTHSSTGDLGIMFGGEKGVIPVSADGNFVNDTGILLNVKTEGGLLVAGAIDRQYVNGVWETSLSDNAETRIGATGISALGSLADGKPTDATKINHMSLDGAQSDKSLILYADRYQPTVTGAGVKASAYTIVVEVKNRVMTVYIKGQEERQLTIGLTDSYQGGYVSFIEGNNTNHAFADFAIWEYEDQPDDWYVVNNYESDTSLGERLENDFDIYHFAPSSALEPATEAEATATNIDGDTSTVGTVTISGTAFKKLCTDQGSLNQGFMKVMMPDGTKVSALTYTKQRMTDFTAEMGYFACHAEIGMMFGAELGKMPYTSDGKLYDDTGVMVRVNMQGVLAIYGAIDISTIDTTDTRINNYSDTNLGYVSLKPPTESLPTIMTSDALIEPISKAAPTDGSEYKMVVQVKDQVLTVWMEGHEELAFSVGLADTYQGGYVSLFSGSHGNNSIVDFAFTNNAGNSVTKVANVTVDEQEYPAVEVTTRYGYEVSANSLYDFYATDDNGTYYAPTRVGFQNGGNATTFYFKDAAVGTNLTLHAKYTKPTTAEPNIGNVGTSINPEKDGLRFVSRLGVVQNGDAFYATLGGKQYTVEKIGMLISTEAGLNHSSQNGHELVVGVDNKYVKDVLIHDANATHTDIYFDVCDTYTDVSVCVLGLGNYPPMPVVARAYVVINIGGQAQTFYTDVVTDQYTRT